MGTVSAHSRHSGYCASLLFLHFGLLGFYPPWSPHPLSQPPGCLPTASTSWRIQEHQLPGFLTPSPGCCCLPVMGPSREITVSQGPQPLSSSRRGTRLPPRPCSPDPQATGEGRLCAGGGVPCAGGAEVLPEALGNPHHRVSSACPLRAAVWRGRSLGPSSPRWWLGGRGFAGGPVHRLGHLRE